MAPTPDPIWFLGLTSEQWDLVGTIATALSFIVAAAAALVAVVQLGHSRRIHREQTRPYMVMNFECSEASVSIADLVIKNIGTTPAHNLTIKVEPPLQRTMKAGTPIAEARIFTGATPMWAPGFEFRQYFDNLIERTKARDAHRDDPTRPEVVDHFTATLVYFDGPPKTSFFGRKPNCWEETSRPSYRRPRRPAKPSAVDWTRGFELALEEARRSIDAQRGSVESLRGRAAGLLAAAGGVAALFLGLGDNHGTLSWVALGVVLLLAGMTVVILRPRSVRWDLDAMLITAWFAEANDVTHMLHSATTAHSRNYVKNEEAILRMHRVYFAGCCAFVVEATLLALDIVLH